MPKLQCSVTGLWYSVTTNHKRELVEKFGSEDELTKTYVSRDARRLRKEGKTDVEIRQMVENGELATKTNAPKRLGSKAVKTNVKTARKQRTDTDTETEQKPVKIEDPDVEAFLQKPAGDASSKAV